MHVEVVLDRAQRFPIHCHRQRVARLQDLCVVLITDQSQVVAKILRDRVWQLALVGDEGDAVQHQRVLDRLEAQRDTDRTEAR